MTLEQLTLVLRADLTNLQQGLGQAVTHVKQMQEQFKQAGQQSAGHMDAFASRTSLALGAVRRAFALLGVSITLGAIVAEASHLEMAMRRLQIQLTNMGVNWAHASSQITFFVREMQRAAGISQVELAQGLLSATTRGFNMAQSMELVGAAAKVASATGRDMDAVLTALMLSTQGYTRHLVRMGIITRDEARNGIMMSEVIKRINQRFTETGKEGPVTFEKALALLRTSVGSLFASLGAQLLPALREFVLWVTQIVQHLDDWVQRNQWLYDAIIGPFVLAIRAAGAGVQMLITWLSRIRIHVADAYDWLAKLAESAAKLPIIGRLFAGIAGELRDAADHLREVQAGVDLTSARTEIAFARIKQHQQAQAKATADAFKGTADVLLKTGGLAKTLEEEIREGMKQSLAWINMMREEGKLSAAELEAAFGRIRDRILASALTAQEKSKLIFELNQEIRKIREEDAQTQIKALDDEVKRYYVGTLEQRKQLLQRLKDLLAHYDALAKVDATYALARKKIFDEITRVQREGLLDNLGTMEQFARNAIDSLSKGMAKWVGEVTRGTKHVGSLFTQVFDDILSAWEKTLAKMIEDWITSQLASLFTQWGWLPTPPGPAAPAAPMGRSRNVLQPTMQTGGMVRPPTGAQAVMALLHRGEQVLTPTQQMPGEPGGITSGVAAQVNVTIQAIDTQTGADFLMRNTRTIADAILSAMRANHPLRRQIASPLRP
jgi:hypothetical protein